MKLIKGITFGAMDFLHPGHLAMLEEARSMCDHLIVGLHTNPQIDRPKKNRPFESVYERYLRLKGCKYVDEIIPYDTEKDLINLLHTVKPDIRIIGEDYKDKDFTGKGIVPHMYNSRQHDWSSSQLRRKLNV